MVPTSISNKLTNNLRLVAKKKNQNKKTPLKTPKTVYHPEHLVPTVQHGDGGVMGWA